MLPEVTESEEPVGGLASPEQQRPISAVSMVMNRSLSPEEIDLLGQCLREGVTNVCDAVSRLDPAREFTAGEHLVFGAMFPLLGASPDRG